jgi:hypothetical protein
LRDWIYGCWQLIKYMKGEGTGGEKGKEGGEGGRGEGEGEER